MTNDLDRHAPPSMTPAHRLRLRQAQLEIAKECAYHGDGENAVAAGRVASRLKSGDHQPTLPTAVLRSELVRHAALLAEQGREYDAGLLIAAADFLRDRATPTSPPS